MWPFGDQKKLSRDQRHVQDKARAVVDRAKATFNSLPLNRDHERFAEAKTLAAKPDPDWEELFRLELLTLQLATSEALAAQAETIRDQHDRLPPPDRVRDLCRYRPCPQASQGGAASEVEHLRAELIRKLGEVQWDLRKSVELELALERMRREVAFGGALLGSLCLAMICLTGGFCSFPRLVFWAMLFGTLGAVTSLFRRMSDPLDVDLDARHYTPYKNVAMILGGNTDVRFSLIAGPIFALVLVQLFTSRLLTGTLFPELEGTLTECLVTSAKTDLANYAKLAVWSFIGDFVEAFVPDVVNRLAGRGRDQAQANNSQK